MNQSNSSTGGPRTLTPRGSIALPMFGEPSRTDELLRQISDAGFTDVAKTRLSGGIAQLLTATRSA